MRNIVAASVFRLIQIALLPIATVGYVLWVVKIIKFSRESGASATVLASTRNAVDAAQLGHKA